MKKIFGFAVVFTLAGCSAAQVEQTQNVLASVPADLAAACATATAAAALAQSSVKGGASNTVSSLADYVTAGCATGEAISTLAADPSSTEWVQNLTTALNTTKTAS